MDIIERFLKYVSIDTQSAEDTGKTPSTNKQWDLAHYLKDELESIGLEDVELDELGYLYATLPANTEKEIPTIGFISHMDTSPDCSGNEVKPRIVENTMAETSFSMEKTTLSRRHRNSQNFWTTLEKTSSSPTDTPCWEQTTRLALRK